MERIIDPPSIGTLHLSKGVANPFGAKGCELYTLQGDSVSGSIQRITPVGDAHLSPGRAVQPQTPFRLKILHFNDLHGHLVQFGPAGFRPVFSRMVWQIREARRCCDGDPNSAVLALSGGDDLIGSAFDELVGEDKESYSIHAGYHLYSRAGVDAGVLGNHDLDIGPSLLAHAIQTDASFPLLSANMVDPGGLSGICYPAVILVIKGVRIGLIGLTTSAEVVRRRGARFEIADPVQVVHNILPALKPYCDILILLTHLGRSLSSSSAVMKGAGDEELARSLPYGAVHLIVGGHTHHALNEKGLSPENIVNGIPIVQAGTMGRFIGEANITVRPPAAVTHTRLWLTTDLPVDEQFERDEIDPLIERIKPFFNHDLGEVANEPDLSTEAVRNSFATGESAMANFVVDGIATRCRLLGHAIDFAMIDSSILRAGLEPGGRLRYGDWFNIMPFADTIRFCHLTGQELKDLLEDNAKRIDLPDEPNTERGFLHFSREVRYQILLGRRRMQNQASEITVAGRPLDEQLQRVFTAAVTNFARELSAPWERYMAAAEGFTPIDLKKWACQDTDLFLRSQMVAHIQAHGGVTRAGGAKRDGRLVVQSLPSDFP